LWPCERHRLVTQISLFGRGLPVLRWLT